VEPGNVEQTAEKILMLLSKPNIRFNFAKNGLETAQTFSVEKEIRATWRYFKRLKDS
jgi:glycosyltransferase involved in cell wall biosynthesis